jgi:hypothetical protein
VHGGEWAKQLAAHGLRIHPQLAIEFVERVKSVLEEFQIIGIADRHISEQAVGEAVGAARFNAFNWACAKNVLLQARWEKAECVINSWI